VFKVMTVDGSIAVADTAEWQAAGWPQSRSICYQAGILPGRFREFEPRRTLVIIIVRPRW